ncbi:hypothetical protein BCR42DRAFT_424341 [Absidia repens]|uniref:Phosphatidate cytidylyltransferase n=1 Tax=Absidia repens TaxID=90262 RepID=A0A1X2I4D8_9FUNG|nr:hypothetical protein BCR42DRAFT_424341 [Absidia repens]
MTRAVNRPVNENEKPILKKKQTADARFSHIQPKGSWEIPRKIYHYSIGFLVLKLFLHDYDTRIIYPPLAAFLCLVLTGEFLRFQFDWFNVLYCKVLGPLMRQSEVSTRFNGVVYYLAGCIIVLYLFPRDIAALSIIYLSWTDPTASICGRLWGQYTPRCGNKSLAGSMGAWITGSLVTFYFFGTWQYSFVSSLSSTPLFMTSYDLHASQVPLFVLSLYGGFVAAFSEFIGDSLGLDDNLTIPVVSACMLWIPLIGFGLAR